MKLLIAALTGLAFSSCFATETAKTNSTIVVKFDNSTSDNSTFTEPKTEDTCVYSNLEKVIGHSDFSIYGKTSSCEYFYLTGYDIKSPSFNASSLQKGFDEECRLPYKPIFYRKNGEKSYHLLAARRLNLYLFDCEWKASGSGYFSCFYNESMAQLKSLNKPTPTAKEIQADMHFSDPNTDYLHFCYKNEHDKTMDGIYSLTNFNFTANIPNPYGDSRLKAFDPDLKRFYYESNGKFNYAEVAENNGTFEYSQASKELLKPIVPGKAYKAISFSGDFYIAKTEEGETIQYYIGQVGEEKPLCFASSTDTGLAMELLVKVKEGSLYDQIRNSIDPQQPTTTVPSVPTTKKSATANFVSVFLTFVLLFVPLYLQ